MDFFTLSHKGMVRPNNEDSVEAIQIKITGINGPSLNVLAMILADGMGGAAAGEFASAMAIKTVKWNLLKGILEQPPEDLLNSDLPKFLGQCFCESNEAIYRQAQSNPDFHGMGTTIVTGIIHRDVLVLGSIGDSRAYLLRAGVLEHLTHDHSLVQEMIDRGELTRDQAFTHPSRNVITRALGVDPTVEGDCRRLDLMHGDVVLFCSDGLCGFVEDRYIEKAIRDHLGDGGTLATLGQRLIDMANACGGGDNISVALYRHA